LQQQDRFAAVEGAVQRHAADFQAPRRDLVQQGADDVVGLLTGFEGAQRDGVAALLVQQHGGGVAEFHFVPCFLGPPIRCLVCRP
jgi:hypothetical protein